MIGRKGWQYGVAALFLTVVLGLLGSALYVHGGLRRAERYARHELWRHARDELQQYLWMRPGHAEARLLMAEAIVKDPQRTGGESIAEAIGHLQKIRASDALGARARVQEARLRLFELDQPDQAEERLEEALRLAPDDVEAHYLMWKLLELTSRFHLVEPHFWKVYEKASTLERGARLREWYLSQFFPQVVTKDLDVMLGVLSPTESATRRSEADRLIRFRRAEPDRALAHIAMARWFQAEGDPEFARGLLDQAQAAQIRDHQGFLIASQVSVLMDLGEFDQAVRRWEVWTADTDSYEYWHWTGVVHEQAQGDFAAAAAAYQKAIGIWPGVIDWRTRHRLVNCFLRLGETVAAQRARDEAARIESLQSEALHQRLSQLLNAPDPQQAAPEFADFYAKIGRPREAAGWKAVAELPATKR